MDDREIVSSIRASLAQRIGKDRYEVWFGPTTQLAVQGESLVVTVPSQFFQDWLRSHFRKDLEASSLEACGRAAGARVSHRRAGGRPIARADAAGRQRFG